MRKGYCRMCESTIAGPTGLCHKCQRDYEDYSKLQGIQNKSAESRENARKKIIK